MKIIKQEELSKFLQDKDNIIIDVRTKEEYNIEHIKGAINLPIDNFEIQKDILKKHKNIVCYCNSGNTSSQFCKRANSAGFDNVHNLVGGIGACNSCEKIKKKGVLPLMQQVQVAAGSLVLFGIALAIITKNYYYIGISAFVGAGLVFAGSTGRCGLAKLLVILPRNREKSSQNQTEIYGKDLIVKQFEDKNLAHYSYIAISNGEAIVVDPERNPQKYYDFAKTHDAKIIGVMNTHPHADFASGHLQIHNDTGATIYVGDKVGAEYDHKSLAGGEVVNFGSASVNTYFTPGHSPDSISYLVKDSNKKEIAFFTGDWLFIGDVGRADLRESVGNIKAKQAELAGQMYDTTREILPKLDTDIYILPAHGAGTSCGKGLSKMNVDLLGNQLINNPMLQDMTRDAFIRELTSDQPAIPAYFTNSVLLNKKGNTNFGDSKKLIQKINNLPTENDILFVDARDRQNATNYPVVDNAIIIDQNNKGFTGMLGSVIKPTQKYIIITDKNYKIDNILNDILSIGYENNLLGIYSIEDNGTNTETIHHSDVNNANNIILDVRSESSYNDNKIYDNSINIPLEKLIDNLASLDKNNIYIPYCGGSFKSDIALSILLANGYKAKKLQIQ